MQVTISEAARLLGFSEKTIRRRVVRGELPGIREATPQGYTWFVDVPDDQPLEPETETPSGELQALRELNVALRDRVDAQDRELDAKNQQLAAKDEQIRELHILLQHAQAALPAPRKNLPWWRFWER
jgi:predicted DNA-binding transcriptional regulator YafY